MKRFFLFAVCACFLICPLYSETFQEYQAQQAKQLEELRKEQEQKHKKYKTKMQQDYDAYRRSMNEKFAEMMKKQPWTKRTKNAAVPLPKSKEPPKPTIKKDDKRTPAVKLNYTKIINVESFDAPRPIVPIAASDPIMKRNAVGDPIMAKDSLGDPIMKRNALGDPIMAKDSLGDPIMKKNALGDPIMAKDSLGDPIMKRNALGDPIMAKDSLGDPIMKRNALGDPIMAKGNAQDAPGTTNNTADNRIMASATAEEYEQPYSFVYHGTVCRARFSDSMRFSLPNVSEVSVSEVWKKLSSEDFDVLLADCLDLKEDLRLGDWGYIDILRTMSEHFLGVGSNEAVLLQMYVLAQSGYKVRIARTGNKLVLLVPFRTDIYTYPYFLLGDGKKYYILDKDAGQQSASYQIYEGSFPREKTASLKMPGTPKLSQERGSEKIFQSRMYQDTFAEVVTNKNLIDFYNNYPVSGNWGDYVRASLSEGIKNSLYPALRAQINGKTKLDAANILMNFVQTAFEYKTDQEQFGYERPLFGDETFYYPYSDCEDRSILFAILVRELLALDVVLIRYPQHLATAVNFGDDDVFGSYFVIDGKKYVVSDPTYIGAPIGECMLKYKNSGAEVIRL